MVRSNRSRKRAHVSEDNTEGSGSHSHFFSVSELAAPEDELIPAYIHRVSEDRRRNYTERLDLEPPSPVKRSRLAGRLPAEEDPPWFDPSAGLEDFESFSLNSERYQLGSLDDEPPRPASPVKLRRPVKPSVSFLCLLLGRQREANRAARILQWTPGAASNATTI
jgi:hypothetical protein